MVNLLRTYYKTIHPFKKIYWYITRPHLRGAICVVECNGKFLLVRHDYGHKLWTFFGGRVNRDEEPEAAAIREAKEEVGIVLRSVTKIGEYESNVDYKQDHIDVFYAQVSEPFYVLNPVELREVNWFAPRELPRDRSPRVDQVFDMLRNHDRN
ncbi:MAG TPA: NUDIX hydrolase [Candidatus Nanoarchaeia archaeon]|nr:NUDIX hydrolase [Candidatus Nanoarchaeia archaeon]